MSVTITIDEVHNSLSELLERVKAATGEIIVADGTTPVARIVPVPNGDGPAPQPRVPGSAKGEFVVPDDFNDPLPDDLIDEWYK